VNWKEVQKALRGKKVEDLTAIVFHIGTEEEYLARVELILEGGDRVSFEPELGNIGEHQELWVNKNESRG